MEARRKEEEERAERPGSRSSLATTLSTASLKPRKSSTMDFEDDFDAYDRDVFNYASTNSRSKGMGGGGGGGGGTGVSLRASRTNLLTNCSISSSGRKNSSMATTAAAARQAALIARKERNRTVSEKIYKYNEHNNSDSVSGRKGSSHGGSKEYKINASVLVHSLLLSLVRSHRSLIRLLHTARFARALRCYYSLAHALRCAHSYARSLTPELMRKRLISMNK